MAIEEETPTPEDYVKPNPQDNPRNISLKEIAARVAETHKVDAAETISSVDDEGNVTPPAGKTEEEAPPAEATTEEKPTEIEPPAEGETPTGTEEPPATGTAPSSAEPVAPGGSPIDPNAEYEVEVEGVKLKVPGQKIIDAGLRTLQKETSADYRLQVASQILKEAEAKLAAAQGTAPEQPPTGAPKKELSDVDLGKAIQFGTPEEAAEAIKTLRERGIGDPAQIQSFIVQATRAAARDEIAYNSAVEFVQKEYKDLLDNPMLRRLFFAEENRRRAPRERGGEGDQRPYKDLYKSIGDDLRKALNLKAPDAPSSGTPPTSSAAGRVAVKRAAPTVPRTAAARLEQGPAATKAKTASEIIAAMAESRGKTNLAPRLRKE